MKPSEIVWREGGDLAPVQIDALDHCSLGGSVPQSAVSPAFRLIAAGMVAAAALPEPNPAAFYPPFRLLAGR